MRKHIINCSILTLLGLLISFGPQFLFKACNIDEESIPRCYWSVQSEIGIGMIITMLGICFIVFADSRTRFGLTIGIFFASIVALLIPNLLIGGCGMMSMACRRVTFPSLSIVSIMILLWSVANMVFLEIKTNGV
ncbi:MAG: hypothetical protein Ta2G_18660 [Termitinemataceae bacterium]|nr:MAG: hypothetical protein Ta2G_18660 [Termitinemataceae bacterium]